MKLKTILATVSTALFILGFSATGFAGEHCEKKDRDVAATSAVTTQACLLYTSPSPRDATLSRMPSSA